MKELQEILKESSKFIKHAGVSHDRNQDPPVQFCYRCRYEYAISHVEALERENAELKAEHKKALDDLLVQATHQLQQLTALREFVREESSVLKEVMSWIRNWDAEFTSDDEWDETEFKVKSIQQRAEQILREDK